MGSLNLRSDIPPISVHAVAPACKLLSGSIQFYQALGLSHVWFCRTRTFKSHNYINFVKELLDNSLSFLDNLYHFLICSYHLFICDKNNKNDKNEQMPIGADAHSALYGSSYQCIQQDIHENSKAI